MTGLQAVEALLQFGLVHSLIEKWDVVQVRNELYDLLHFKVGENFKAEEIEEVIEKFNWPEIDESNAPDTATEILTTITDDYIKRGNPLENTTSARDRFEAAVMGRLMPRQSETIARFNIYQQLSPEAATENFHNLCRASNYIQVDRIKKDMYWITETEYGPLEITVNLSKPEKDPKEIEAERLKPPSTYPKCLLCLENVGFFGNENWPARQNLRVIPITLGGDQWYFQYSPYAYYNEHCIIFGEHHRSMTIDAAIFRKLLQFVKEFPHYFVGSNACLPVVGGSILTHEHFQGGRHVFPMENAFSYRRYVHEKYPNIGINLLKWPMSVIRLSAPLSMEEHLISLADYILAGWHGYSDGDVVAYTGDVPHNTITPIARLKDDMLELDLVLRNNRTSKEHPLGIFHPHKEWHHIKKENIGLIEVMGLAVLPSRLKADIERGLFKKDEVGKVFVNVLKDCGVFKDDDEGRARFDTFMKSLAFGCVV